MNVFNAEFVKGAVSPDNFPDLKLPEAAFAGRSNVGKSTLLNSIVNRKNLARTSSSPGKTREINFFIVDNKWSLADLPGFGYASIGKKYREMWKKLNFEYFEKRENLRLVCLLVDSRHDPTDKDLALMEWMETTGGKFLVILTKCDKISKKLIAERKEQVEHVLQYCNHALEVLPYSAVSGMGREHLTAILKKNLV